MTTAEILQERTIPGLERLLGDARSFLALPEAQQGKACRRLRESMSLYLYRENWPFAD